MRTWYVKQVRELEHPTPSVPGRWQVEVESFGFAPPPIGESLMRFQDDSSLDQFKKEERPDVD